MKASIWRGLMAIGMKFHHFAEPRPPRPNFKIVIPSRLSPRGGRFKLVFYLPDGYLDAPDDKTFPVVINFHGGGFTLGTGTDDARWASTVVHTTGAVFVSVEYRLAPEYPFSTGVEDGVDAVMYVASHADELRIDPHQIALSGFSAGGNYAFTVPLMLHDLQNARGRRTISNGKLRPGSSKNASTVSLPHAYRLQSHNSSTSVLKLSDLEPTALETDQTIPDLTLQCIVSFYPPTDFRIAREDKRATNPAPEKNLPPMLTNLFDQSFLPSKLRIDLSDPYLSPAAATDEFLDAAYPDDIVLYTCEHDMLNQEGVAFGERLSTIGKKLHGGLIKGVPHAFDKKPNPISFPKSADRCYAEACAELSRAFGDHTSPEERRQLEHSHKVERFEAEEAGDLVIGDSDEVQRDRPSLANIRDLWPLKSKDDKERARARAVRRRSSSVPPRALSNVPERNLEELME